MTSNTRMILILILAVSSIGLAAQEPAAPETADAVTPAEATSPATGTTGEDVYAELPSGSPETEIANHQLRDRFSELLRQHPYNVATVLALDPALLNNEEFLTRYPEIDRFVEAHPEIGRHPSFFMAQYSGRTYQESPLEEFFEAVIILAVFVLIAYVLSWIIRTIIEQKRWNRLSQSQSDVHNKILDRFGSSEEVLSYIKTPAGTKFLESAPIPLHAETPSRANPATRVMLSIQAGIVVAAASVGMMAVGLWLPDNTGNELFALGIIAFFTGAGFMLSAVTSIYVSRRLGSWDETGAPPSTNPGL